jgi:hypothetical protein
MADSGNETAAARRHMTDRGALANNNDKGAHRPRRASMTHETASNRRASERTHEAPAKPELERRYGSIGIPAVAAAARYLGAARRPAATA